MIFWGRLLIVVILSLLYTAYFIEIYRHLSQPLASPLHLPRKKMVHRIVLFICGILGAVLMAYIIREYIVPRPIFDLIAISLQTIFTIPFFGALVTDHLLHAWQKKRLPRSITLLTLGATAIIAAGSNLLILFAKPATLRYVSEMLETITDIVTICLILGIGYLGIQYFKSRRQ